MANLASLVSKIPATGLTRTQGIMVVSGTGLAVNVWGNTIPARYADPLVVNAGDTVVVDLMAGPTGQAEAVVSGKLTAAPRPGTGTVTVVPASSSTISVQGTDGTTYTAYFVGSYTPVVNDNVILAWNAATPTVTGKVGVSPGTTATFPIVPQPTTNTGTSTYQATDSATFTPAYGGWDEWAGGGRNVYQGGSAYGASNNGAWFYAGSPNELAGRTITAITFRIGGRRNVGSYNSPVAVHLYAHTSSNRPGGDVTRTQGPYDATIQPGAGPTDIVLGAAAVTAVGPVLQAGGGIGIAGESYAGFYGLNTQPDSGLLTIQWSR